MTQKYLDAVQQPGQTINPLLAFLKMRVAAVGIDHARIDLPAGPYLIQGGGVVAGGILATLLDETMAHAILGGNTDGQRTATVDMNVSYLRPVAEGSDVVCEARVVKRGSRLLFAEGTAVVDGKEVARATGTFLLT